jgi:hypothetical protein
MMEINTPITVQNETIERSTFGKGQQNRNVSLKILLLIKK